MKNNILLVTPGSNDLAVFTARLQASFFIYVADSTNGIEEVIKEKNIQLIVCSAELFKQYANGAGGTAPAMEDDFVKRLHECILENIRNKVLCVDWLASNLNMSRPTLYRKIKSTTNKTPNELIGCARLQRAAHLLASTNYKVFEVAEMVGFSSSSSFGKAFFKKFKVTPVAFQKRCG